MQQEHSDNLSEKPTISILGCGWYGFALAKELSIKGYTVKGSSTTAEKLPVLAAENIQSYLVNFQEDLESYDVEFFNTEILLISIPPKRNTAEQTSFLRKIIRISNAAIKHQVKHIIFISSTAVYGDSDIAITESNVPAPETDSGKAMLEAETFLQSQTAFSTTIIRFAGLVGPNRNPGKFFAGKSDIPNGQAPINLIHLDDCIGLTLSLIQNNAFGYVFNACGPDHPNRQEFYVAAAKASGLTEPTFIDELQKHKLISGENVTAILNYQYKISSWAKWLTIDK